MDPGPDRAVFSISVTSELTDVDPQMLRLYEQRGLLSPHRTDGGTRRYSGRDVEQIHEITALLAAGLNLAGIAHVFQLRNENHRLQDELDRVRKNARQTQDAPATQRGSEA